MGLQYFQSGAHLSKMCVLSNFINRFNNKTVLIAYQLCTSRSKATFAPSSPRKNVLK